MTRQNFESNVLRLTLYNKYVFYLAGVALIFGGLYILNDVIHNGPKYDKYGTRNFSFVLSILLAFTGCMAPLVVKKRYRVLVCNSKLNSLDKLKVIDKLSKKFDSNPQFYMNDFCSMLYDIRKW